MIIKSTTLTCPYCMNSMDVLRGFFPLESYNCSNCNKKFYLKGDEGTFKIEDIEVTYDDLKRNAEVVFPNDKEKQELYIKLLQKTKNY